MTEDRLPLAELMAKAGDGDFLRSVAEAVVQLLMETDVDGLIGAGRHERSGDRTTYRNGYRDRTLDTRLGSLQLRIPKLRQGSYFPPFLEPRRTSEKALVAVIQEAWIGGVSTRRVDDLVQAMGLAGISKSTVSKLCKDIDDRVNAFLDRPLVGDWPYLWLDATSLNPSCGRQDATSWIMIASTRAVQPPPVQRVICPTMSVFVSTPTILPSSPHTTTRSVCGLAMSAAASLTGAAPLIVTKRSRALGSICSANIPALLYGCGVCRGPGYGAAPPAVRQIGMR